MAEVIIVCCEGERVSDGCGEMDVYGGEALAACLICVAQGEVCVRDFAAMAD